jgi:hypothetical protein
MLSAIDRLGESESSWWISRMPWRSASEHLDQGRLARAVLAQQRVDLAAAQIEVHAAQGSHAAEPFDHAAQG